MIHNLRIEPEFFEAVNAGLKPFEVRRNDRDFKVGDFVHLSEYNPKTGCYTGQTIARKIIYVLSGEAFGLREGFCIFAMREF